jgi:hypothetical protein
MKKLTQLACLSAYACCVLAVATVSRAQTVGNSGFETPSLGSAIDEFNPATTVSQPWTFNGRSGIAQNVDDPNAFQVSGSADGQYGFLQYLGASGTGGNFSQTIHFSDTGLFNLSYLEAGRASTNSSLGGNLSYSVQIQQGANPAVLSVVDQTASSQPFTATSFQFLIPNPGDYTLTFATIGFILTPPYPIDDTALFDDVSISAPVPEPSTWLAGAAVFSYLSWLQLRRFRQAHASSK